MSEVYVIKMNKYQQRKLPTYMIRVASEASSFRKWYEPSLRSITSPGSAMRIFAAMSSIPYLGKAK